MPKPDQSSIALSVDCAATVVFLDINGRTVELDDEAAFELVMAVAEGSLDAEAIAA